MERLPLDEFCEPSLWPDGVRYRSARGYGYDRPWALDLPCPVAGCAHPVDEWAILGEHVKTDHRWSSDQLNAVIEARDQVYDNATRGHDAVPH